jgi:hypothetical protein
MPSPPSKSLTTSNAPSPPPRRVPDPTLLRLAHAVVDLNPALAQRLCVAGLAAIEDANERASWATCLAEFLEDGPSCHGLSA